MMQPMQPIVLTKEGTVRFKSNQIILWLLHSGKADLNEIAIYCQRDGVPVEDQEQFWQMLGYSVSGYGDLSFVRPETIEKADAIAEQLLKDKP